LRPQLRGRPAPPGRRALLRALQRGREPPLEHAPLPQDPARGRASPAVTPEGLALYRTVPERGVLALPGYLQLLSGVSGGRGPHGPALRALRAQGQTARDEARALSQPA